MPIRIIAVGNVFSPSLSGPMRILQLCNKPPYPPIDGGTMAMHNLARGLINAGHHVKVLCISTAKHALNMDALPKEFRESTGIEGVFVDTSLNVVDAFNDLLNADNYNISRFFSPDMDIRLIRLLSEEKFDIKADYCLVAIGRKPYTDGLNLENIGIQKDEKGRIAVNDHLETNVPGIFAIGDVVQGAMLAHKAEEEGILVAEIISGAKPHIDYNLIPGVVYTWPEVAAVGKTEEELKSAGIPYKSGKFPFKALGRARASMDTEGLVKVLAHKDTDEILGVHMVGPRVADVIMEAVALMEFRASAEDMSRISHPHPTYTEAVKEAALAATGNRALHI